MGATVLHMDEEQQVGEQGDAPSRVSAVAEDRAAEFLVSGRDEKGKQVWFFRVHVTGLYPRVFGPFKRKTDAIDGFDCFLTHTLQGLCDCGNELMDHPHCLVFTEPPKLKGQ